MTSDSYPKCWFKGCEDKNAFYTAREPLLVANTDGTFSEKEGRPVHFCIDCLKKYLPFIFESMREKGHVPVKYLDS
jgi:hypothetical protein